MFISYYFVSSLVVSVKDLEETAKLGYSEGISKIFLNGLQQLDTHIRPKILDNTFQHSIIHSLIKNDIPYYFSNKIEEVNAVIGQQQLEAYDQILNILKGKNKTDKVEILKRNNKFCDKFNVFLNIQKKEHNMIDTNTEYKTIEDTNTTVFEDLLNEISENNIVINAHVDAAVANTEIYGNVEPI